MTFACSRPAPGRRCRSQEDACPRTPRPTWNRRASLSIEIPRVDGSPQRGRPKPCLETDPPPPPACPFRHGWALAPAWPLARCRPSRAGRSATPGPRGRDGPRPVPGNHETAPACELFDWRMPGSSARRTARQNRHRSCPAARSTRFEPPHEAFRGRQRASRRESVAPCTYRLRRQPRP